MRNTKRDRILYVVLSLTWGLLWTVIGYLIYLGILLVKRKQIIVKGYIHGRRFAAVEGDFGAISLGMCIVFDQDLYLDEETVRHELGHTVQNMFFGILFIPLIAIPSGIRAALWERIQYRHYRKHGKFKNYYGIWFERQANTLGEKYFT